MRNKLIACAALVACATSLQADPITGTTGFTGSFTAANNDLTTSGDVITIASEAINGIPTGSFVGGVLTSFNTTFTLNHPTAPTFPNPLWVITVGTGPGAHVYTFNATSYQTLLDNANINTISGSGTVTDSLDGDTAPGTYNLSFNVTGAGSGATLTWNGTSGSTTPPTVPDGGTTVMLLGSALAGLGLVRRKLS